MSQLIKTNYIYPYKTKDKFDKLILITKESDGTKNFSVVEKPVLEYYITKPEFVTGEECRAIELEKTNRFTCYYKDLFSNMINNLNDSKQTQYYKTVMESAASGGIINKLRKIHLDYRFHATDVNIEDYYIGKFLLKYPSQNNNFGLTKFFYDIEVDGSTIIGFPEAELAECEINIISSAMEIDGEINLFMFCLHYTEEENPSYTNFFKNIQEKAGNIKKELEEKCGKKVKIKIKRFTEELNLLKSFFNLINTLRPDFVLGWNSHRFDFPYIYNRLKFLLEGTNETIEDVMCPKEIPYKSVKYRIDTVKQDPSDNNSTVNVLSYSNHIDQQNLYANLRKGKGKLESYSLDAVSEIELGEHKEELETNIKTQHFDNYDNFFKYSCVDTLLLYMLEEKNHDIEMLYAISQITETRVDQCLKKTVCLRNLASKFYKNQGYTISNNRSSLKEKTGKPRGAYVARTDIVKNIGMELFKGSNLSQYLFEEVCDLDLSSLYPSIIIAFNLSPETFIKKINVRKTEYDQTKTSIEDIVIDDYISKDYVSIGHKYFNLPNMEYLINKVNIKTI